MFLVNLIRFTWLKGVQSFFLKACHQWTLDSPARKKSGSRNVSDRITGMYFRQ
jgi:hypothetical protein